MTTTMQKAITPQMARAYLESGYDRVAGFVVRAADVTFATTPSALVTVHGLTFPGSPFTPDADHVDVLRFPATPQLRFEDATGGVDQESRARTGGPFVDRPPFTGTGFVAVPDHVVPLWWLVHSRVPAGSQLVRVGTDGTQTLLATYVDVAHGWQSDGGEVRAAQTARISRYVGPMATWRGTHLSADPVDGHVVLASEVEPPAELGFEPTAAGRWRKAVPADEVTELFELSVTGRWNGLEMRVVDQWTGADGESLARVSYTGHDADIAEGLRLEKVDAAVYEATVPAASVSALQTVQLIPQSWARA